MYFTISLSEEETDFTDYKSLNSMNKIRRTNIGS